MTTDELHEGPDAPLSAEELELVARLTPAAVAAIDAALLAHVLDDRWRKLAFIVGSAMYTNTAHVDGVPDAFYAMRTAHLVDVGVLECRGDLRYMRYCEIRRL